MTKIQTQDHKGERQTVKNGKIDMHLSTEAST